MDFGKLDSALVRAAADFLREPGVLSLSPVQEDEFGVDPDDLADL